MGILSWIVFGFIAGVLARWLTPGSGPKGCLITSLLGIAGAAIGGWIGTQLGLGTVQGFDSRSLFLAVVGAMLLLLAYSQFQRSGPPR
ncbi:MAG: GlsB/YeaQ/YmgE family stress response membrane protein [Pirellulaceae bacterium]